MSARAILFRTVWVLAVVWPGVQMALVHWAGVHPWRLGAYGMYSTFQRDRVEVFLDGGILNRRAESAEVTAAWTRYEETRRTLGHLASGEDALARLLFRTHPEVKEVRIESVRERLDGTTGTFAESREARSWRR
ncbi:MAG TPA: hypothetical protein VL588_12090 [Bdellovibrionota bacterium]|jgi:hypothetical protein|nr:hypothetical protein [Bdellovibrionota bacterium]